MEDPAVPLPETVEAFAAGPQPGCRGRAARL
jgi:hypothetical protein